MKLLSVPNNWRRSDSSSLEGPRRKFCRLGDALRRFAPINVCKDARSPERKQGMKSVRSFRVATTARVFVADAVSLVSQFSGGATVTLDFTYDMYFGTNPTEKLAIEQAAADISVGITSNLTPITVADNIVSGMAGVTTVDFDHCYDYTNPTIGAPEVIGPPLIGEHSVRVFVGVRNLTGSTLGHGGPERQSVPINALSSDGFAQLQ